MAHKTKTFGGLRFRIDRPKGYVKEWPQDGWTKRFTYPVDYGYLPRHTGEDGEGLDFFVGDDPTGHLESFQKLKRDDHGRRLLDETKFLVGVTDAEREVIYRLYGDEVWHRKVYKDMDELIRDLPKFAAGKKERYREKTGHIHVMRPVAEQSDYTRCDTCGKVEKSAGLEKDAINFGKLRDSFQGLVQRFHGPQPSMLPPMQTPQWHRNLHAEMQRHYHANRGPGSSMVELMTERARQLGYHDIGKAQTMGEMTDGLARLGISPRQQFDEAAQFFHAPSHLADSRATVKANPDLLAAQSTFHARQHLGLPDTRPTYASSPAMKSAAVRAKIAVLARYGFKRADAKFADIDKHIVGEIEVAGANPSEWSFQGLMDPSLREGTETPAGPGRL